MVRHVSTHVPWLVLGLAVTVADPQLAVNRWSGCAEDHPKKLCWCRQYSAVLSSTQYIFEHFIAFEAFQCDV